MKFLPYRMLSVSASLLLLAGSLRAQTTYTYSGSDTTSGNSWSTTTNWTPTPATGGPGGTTNATTDSVVIGTPTTGNLTVTYDSGAGGFLSGLAIQDTGSFNVTLDLLKSLSLANGTGTLTLGGSGTGIATLILDDIANTTANNFAGNVILNANSVLEYTSNNGSGGSQKKPTITGNLTIQGGTVNADGNIASNGNNTPTVTGALTITSGTLDLFTSPSNGTAVSTPWEQFTVDGALHASGGAITSATSSSVASLSSGAAIFLASGNASNPSYIAGTTTFNTGIPIIFAQHGAQAFYSSVTIGALGLEEAGSAGNTTDTISHALSNGAIDTAGTLNLGAISYLQGFASSSVNKLTLQLGSNVTVTTGANQLADNDASANGFQQLDLNGKTLDTTAVNTTTDNGYFAPGFGGTAGTTATFDIIDSTSGGGGTIKALGFDLSQVSALNVGTTNSTSGIINLIATGAGSANNLGGGGTIAANSTFYYAASTGTNTTVGTLTSNRSIGGLRVGTSGAATGSRLELLSAITTQGKVQVDSGAILDVNAQTLTLSGTSVLTGGGAITSGVVGGAVTWASGATGGIEPGSAIGSTTAQQLSFSGTAGGPLAITLLSTSVSNFNINSSSSFDAVLLGTNVTLTNAGSLVLDFTSGYNPINGTTIDLFNTTGGGTDTGSFSSITSNLTGDTFTLNNGVLTVTSSVVPEPSSTALLLGALGVGAFAWRLRRLRNGLLVNR